MNKRISTLLASAVFLTMFSVNAQNAVPEWYKDGSGFKNAFAGPTAQELQDSKKLDLNDPANLTYRNGNIPGWSYSAPLSSLTVDAIDGIFVSFDSEDGPIAPGLFKPAYENYESVNTPIYSKVTIGDNAYLGVLPTMNNQARVELVLSTKGLKDVTSLHFKLGRYGNTAQINRNITWTIVSAKAYDLDVTDMAEGKDIPYEDKFNFMKVSKEGVTLYEDEQSNPVSTSEFVEVRMNTASTSIGQPISLDNKLIRVVLESEPSVSDNNSTSEKLEPMSLFTDVTLDFVRPAVTIDYTKKEFSAGLGRTTECQVDKFTVNVHKFSTVAEEDYDDLATTYLKLNVKKPFALKSIAGEEVDESLFGYTSETDGSVSYYIHKGTMTTSGENSKVEVVYYAAPEALKYDAANYIYATMTSVSRDTAYVNQSVNAYPIFKFKENVRFTKYTEKQEAEFEFSNFPNFNFNGFDNRLELENLTPADHGSTSRFDDKIEFERFNWYLNGVFQDDTYNEILEEAVDCMGNLKSGWTVKALFDFNTDDINIDETESFKAEERFGLASDLEYRATNPAFAFTGENFRDLGPNYYIGLIASASNQFVWTRWNTLTGKLSDVMGIREGLIGCGGCSDGVLEMFSRAEIFAAPYATSRYSEENYGVKNESREHVVRIFVSGLTPDENDPTVATIKLYKEGEDAGGGCYEYSFGSSCDEDIFLYQDKTFSFSSDSPYAYWLNGDQGNLEKEPGSKYYGWNSTDTLYFTVPYTSEIINKLKNEGLPVKMKYTLNATGGDGYGDVVQGNKLNFAQFCVKTNDHKGFNEFNVIGTSFRGVISTLTGDIPVGGYNSFIRDLDDLERFNFGTDYDANIFRDMFLKDYGVKYIGQDDCYENKESGFYVAGLNLIAPVKVDWNKSNKLGAFKYTVTPLEGYGEYKEVKGSLVLVPNQYGELVARVNAVFDPADKAGLKSDTLTSASHKPYIANFVKDQVSLYPIQIDQQIIKTYVYGLDERYICDCHIENHLEDTRDAEYFNLFCHYGAYRIDTVKANIKGDVKKPELFYATTPSTTASPLTTLDFGAVTITNDDMHGSKALFLIGKDIPAIDPNSSTSAKVAIGADGDLISLAESANQSIYENEVIIPLTVGLHPDKEALASNTDVVRASVLCNANAALNVKYQAQLQKPVVDTEFLEDNVHGSMAQLRWSLVPAAEYYTVEIGKIVKDKTSKNIFISEVKAEDGQIMVELFNGTGADINTTIHHNYKVRIYKNGVDMGNVWDVVGMNGSINKAYTAVAHTWNADLSPSNVYTIKLLEGGVQIDIFEFDNTTRLSRVEKDGLEENAGSFNIADWEARNGSLPVASYPWNFKFESGKVSGPLAGPTVSISNLKPQTEYTVRVTAFSYAKGVVPAQSDDEKFYTSLHTEEIIGDGTPIFEGAVGNEVITTSQFSVIGGEGNVTILNASGRKVVINNILGQVVANTILPSDNETLNVPSGIVVVSVDGQTPVKTVVK